MYSVLGLLALAVAIAAIYKLLTWDDKSSSETPNKVDNEPEATNKSDEQKTVQKPTCGCGRSSTGYCVGLHRLSDAEWAISDKNPNRVEVAPVVVTADTPVTPVAEQVAEETPTKKTRSSKPKKAAETAEKPKKPRAKKAK